MDFTTTGNGTSGSIRSLQVGDVFSITPSITRAFGQVGFSLNDNGSQGANYANRISGSRLFINTDNYGSWYVGGLSGNGTKSFNYNPSENIYRDYRFEIRITSATTADVDFYVNGVFQSRAYNLILSGLAGSNIDAFSMYGSDMWDGGSNDDGYFKNGYVADTGIVNLGYYLGGTEVFSPGQVADGLAADSTSTLRVNDVFIGGDAGSQVNLAQANTYTGNTTVNLNATTEAQNANALGSTAAGTTVTSGGALKLYSPTGISYASEALVLNGVGVSNANGALRNVGGNNTWNGNISLNSNSRINADAGSLTISGNVSSGANVLFLGAQGSNIAINGQISGSGNTQHGSTTSLYKDGNGTVTLDGANTYTGDTRVAAGTLTVGSGGNLGSNSYVYLYGNTTLNVNNSVAVASVSENRTGDSGVMAIASGATLTINGANFGTRFQNSISGSGNLTFSGTGNSTLSLFGTQDRTGTTTVTSGNLTTQVAMSSSAFVITGGNFSTSAGSQIDNNASITLSGGTFTINGSDTVGALSGSGGTLNLGSNTLTTSVSAGSSSFSGTITGTGGGLTKSGSGELILAGTSNYTGSTSVSAGTLRVNGSLGATAVSVSSGATLGGNATISGAVTLNNGGTLAPGNSVGTMDLNGGLTLNSGGNVTMEITGASTFDRIIVTGGSGISYGGVLHISLGGFTPAYNSTYDLFDGERVPSTNFSSILFSDSFDGTGSTFNPENGTLTVVPEPSTWALIGVGAAFVLWRLRRRKA